MGKVLPSDNRDRRGVYTHKKVEITDQNKYKYPINKETCKLF